MKTYKSLGLVTSWDDGSPYDLRVAELLDKYKVHGIFYIPITNGRKRVMTRSQIRQLASRFEIGAHTYSHADLTSISLADASSEILRGKAELENILGRKIERFCYPRGKFNQDIKRLVKELGFKEARTARIIFMGRNLDPFEMNPNLHVYNHNKLTYLGHCLKNGDLNTAKLVCRSAGNSFIQTADKLICEGFHVWGHGWELEEKGLWKDLENFIRFSKSLRIK